jgi:hypothetical protein
VARAHKCSRSSVNIILPQPRCRKPVQTFLVLFLVMDVEKSPTYVALPERAKPAWLRAIRALPLIAPAAGEVF